MDSAEVSEVLRSRRITFAGSFEPVQHRCRAPRPDGRLCERQDRLKVRRGRGGLGAGGRAGPVLGGRLGACAGCSYHSALVVPGLPAQCGA